MRLPGACRNSATLQPTQVNPADFPSWSSASPPTRCPLVIDDYADNILAQQLSRILGVGSHDQGERKPSFESGDPLKLAAMG